MKRRVKRFVSNQLNYEFPDEQSRLDWNFTTLIPKVTKFPGMSGGQDEYGRGWIPSELGSITFAWKLISSTGSLLRAKREAARGMAGSGRGILLTIPEDQIDETRGLRWAEVRPINIAISENASTGTTSQDVQGTFQAADPTWYGCQSTTDTSEPVYNRDGWWHLDDGITLDSGRTLGGPRVVQAGVDPITEITCINRGNHVTSPVIRISIGTIAGILGVRRLDAISRIVQEGFEWRAAMTAGQVLVIDCKNGTLTLETTIGDTDAYFDFYAVTGIGLIELAAGTNILEFYGDFAGITIEISYPDAWY